MHPTNSILAFLLYAASGVLAGTPCPSVPPPLGISCVHEENGKQLNFFYGDDIWWHAWHVATSGAHGVSFPIASPAEKQQQRENAVSRLSSSWPENARDEKPLASMRYEGDASVCKIALDESNAEGLLTNDIGNFKKSHPNGLLAIWDNRTNKDTVPAHKPQELEECDAPRSAARPHYHNEKLGASITPRAPLIAGLGVTGPVRVQAHEHNLRPQRQSHPRRENPSFDFFEARSLDDSLPFEDGLSERELDALVEDYIYVKRQLDFMDRLEKRYDSLLGLNPREDVLLEYMASFSPI